MFKLYFGNPTAIISTIFLVGNIGYMLWGYLNRASIQKWGWVILFLILLNGVLWYFANVRDHYSNSIVYAVDGSVEVGLFSVGSIQSIVYWLASCLIWIGGIIAIFKPQYRKQIFCIISLVALVQIIFIEGSRIWLYNVAPSNFNYIQTRWK